MLKESGALAPRGAGAVNELALGVPRSPTSAPSLPVLEWKRLAALAGRAAAVALPLAVWGRELVVRPAGLAFLLLATATWLAASKFVFCTTRTSLGAGLAATLGGVGGLVVVSACQLWLPAPPLLGRPLVEAAATILLASSVWELLVERCLCRRKKVLILGAGDAAAEVVEETGHERHRHFDVVGALAAPDEAVQARDGLRVLGSLSSLSEVVEAQHPDLIVIAHGDTGTAVDLLLESRWRSFRVVGLSHFFEDAFGQVPIRHITPAWFMSILHARQPAYHAALKRAFDLLVAAVVLVLVAPLLAVVALLVRISGKPVIYRQRRLGERGATFEIYKFRTMISSAEHDCGARWAGPDDPRVTRVGHFLRKSRIDELPQLWNVLHGEMSLVGPRPERPELVRCIEESVPFWNRRLLLKPGLTGWAQLRGGYADSCAAMATKLSYDLWYMRHRSLLLDVAICLKTLTTVVSGAGAR